MLETDLLLDRRRLKRRLIFWRVLSVALLVVALCILAAPRLRFAGAHIARVNIDGVITDDRAFVEAVTKLAHDASVKAVIVSIDSPGGSVAGGESLHDALVRVAAAKPVVAVMRGTAASAGYMVALPSARIFAREATLTGSIGVLLETGEVSGLLGKLGITTDALTSGPLKDQPSYTRPLSPAGREYLQGIVGDMFDQFVTMVAEGRHMDKDAVRKLADGRAYTGRQAVQLGLVDAIGGEIEAQDWLEKTDNITRHLPVLDLHVGNRFGGPLRALLGDLSTALLGRLPAGAWAIWTGRDLS